MLSKITPYLFCFLLLTGGSLSVVGQEPDEQSSASADPRVEQLKKEIALEKLRADLAEQRKRSLAAKLPAVTEDPANKRLTGEIKVSDEDNETKYETESVALSYEAVSIIAKQISDKLQSGAGDFNQIVIYSDTDFPTLVQYRIFESQAVPALNAYDFLLKTERGGTRGGDKGVDPLQLLPMGSAIVESAIDVISLFRTDTTISNKKVNIKPTALGALVANEMRLARPGLKVYFPEAYIPDHDWEPEDENSVLTQLTKLYAYQEVTKGILADYATTAPGEKDKHRYHSQIPALTALNDQVARMLANYENKEGENAINRLRQLLRAEQLNRMLESDPKTGILQLKVLESSGSQRITRNLILGSKIRHSGGAIASYLLFDKTGALRSSEMFYYHTGFQKMNNIRGLRN